MKKQIDNQEMDSIRKRVDRQDEASLRQSVLEVEAQIKAIVGKEPLDFYFYSLSPEVLRRIDGLLFERSLILDRMFTYSEEEVRRIGEVNALLADMRQMVIHDTADYYRTMVRCHAENDRENCDVNGSLAVLTMYHKEVGDKGSVLHLDNDAYYGSDFAFMLFVRRMNNNWAGHDDSIASCSICCDGENVDKLTDEELTGERLDDCMGCLNPSCPALEQIQFSYTFNNLYNHEHYPMADIIRINCYDRNIKVDYDHFNDQNGRRFDGAERVIFKAAD